MVETFQMYGGSGWMLCWFVIAWIYLLISEKKKNYRIMFVYAPAIVLLLFFNPLFFTVFGDLTEELIYFRFLWLLPIIVVVGYSIIRIFDSLAGKKRYCFAAIAVVLVVLSGKLVYTNPLFSKAENEYHVPQTVVDICDAIKVDGREVMAAFPQEFILYVRQYTSKVCMPYGREVVMGVMDELHFLMNEEEIDVRKLSEILKSRNCHYVVISEEKNLTDDLENYGYTLFDIIDGYCIYRDTTIYIGL